MSAAMEQVLVLRNRVELYRITFIVAACLAIPTLGVLLAESMTQYHPVATLFFVVLVITLAYVGWGGSPCRVEIDGLRRHVLIQHTLLSDAVRQYQFTDFDTVCLTWAYKYRITAPFGPRYLHGVIECEGSESLCVWSERFFSDHWSKRHYYETLAKQVAEFMDLPLVINDETAS